MKRTILLTMFVLGMMACARAQNCSYIRHSMPDGYIAPDDPAVAAKLEQWKDLKFGVIFHWGLYSVPGICESWPLCSEDWITRPEGYTYENYKQWYWGLINLFNPTKFNPQQWAEVTSRAGMKYMIFTTKHHDGFCMFDTKETDYSVTHAPLFRNNPKADVTKHITEAFREKNIWIGLYFSKPDWHSQLFWNNDYGCAGRGINYFTNNEKGKKMWADYGIYCRNQLIEITQNYGPIDILWLDGGWIEAKDVRIEEVLKNARSLSPGMISVDRAMRSKWENYITPEQSIPEAQLHCPWESCITLTQSWGYTPDPQYKTSSQVIAMLAQIVAKGGSLLLGIGPSPEGIIEQATVNRLDTIGQWMKSNGEAIYNTRTTPIYTNRQNNIWFTADKNQSCLYAIITENGDISWTLNTPKGKITDLATGKNIPYSVRNGETTLHVDHTPMAIRFSPDPNTLTTKEIQNQNKTLTERFANLLTETEKYVAYRTLKTPLIDGKIEENEWKNAPWTNTFTDISGEGHPKPRFSTRAKMLWDDDNLYIAAEIEEPDVWATLTKRDEIIFQDNDFEIFLDPDNDGKNYYEIELNALGTIFDLYLQHAYRSPDSAYAAFSWNAPGMRSAVAIQGTINDNRDKDQGWTVEVAIPRTAITDEFANVLQAGKTLSIGFSRVEWQTDKLRNGGYKRKTDKNGKLLPEDNWTWGPTGRIAMHMPERWGKVYLSGMTSDEQMPVNEQEKLLHLMWAMFYLQEETYEKEGHYLTALQQFHFTPAEMQMAGNARLSVEAYSRGYLITATFPDGSTITLNHNGVVDRRKAPQPKIAAYGWYVWEDPEVTEDSLFNLFCEWRKHGLKGVCANNFFDYAKIERCARTAHRAGLEYHAWAPTVIQADKDSSWYTVNRLGQSAYVPKNRAYVEYYQTVDPHNPEVIKYLAESYLKIASIPDVDYVQLDYIRYADAILAEGLWQKFDSLIHHEWRDAKGKVHEYPGGDYCYCDACCADFKSKTGIDIKQKMAEGVDPQTINEWAQFRCDIITNLVNTICDTIHAHGYRISADVFPGPEGYAEPMVRQQWRKWGVDMLFPMNYNDFYLKNAEWVGEMCRQECRDNDIPVVSGLFICPDWRNKAQVKDPEFSGLLPSEIGEAIRSSIEAGAKAICLFTPLRMSDEHWQEFEKAIK